ncbi:MAG TPA: hypothetical protein VEG60_18610 [Candidatus Binatia bacterium]|nr:hypothetical protein [Candidatus Binatia bacterium]
MENLAPVVLLILFALLPLINYILSRLRRRFQQPPPQRQPAPDMGFRRQAAPSAARETREAPRMTPPTEPIMPRRDLGSRRALFITRRDLRRAIIAMTVLGPCRANEPPD